MKRQSEGREMSEEEEVGEGKTLKELNEGEKRESLGMERKEEGRSSEDEEGGNGRRQEGEKGRRVKRRGRR